MVLQFGMTATSSTRLRVKTGKIPKMDVCAGLLQLPTACTGGCTKQYDQTYPEEDGPMSFFTRPSYEFNGVLGEDVSTFFRETCRNTSSYTSFGINWFVTGFGSGIPYRNTEVANNFKGFFRQVFSMSDVIATTEKPLTKEKFNNIIKEAFRTNSALTFSVAISGGHAMTISP